MEEGVIDIKDDSKEQNDEWKEAECPNDTPPDEIEEIVSDRNDEKNENMMREKRQNSRMKLLLLIRRKV